MKRKGQGNPKAERNERIVSHLIKRFKERHDITLTRSRRLMLIKQIQTKVAKRLCLVPNGKFLYRVSMYDNDTRSSVGYSVIYCPRFEQILTVLPRQDSPEYDEFVKNEPERVDTSVQGGISQQQYLDDMRGPWYYEGDDDEDQ